MGALISGLATVLASSFGGSDDDFKQAQLELQHQNARLQASTNMAMQAGENYQRSVENQLGALGQSSQQQQAASQGKMEGFRNALLGRF